ncbi:hypothetical protein BSMD_005190 [Bacillus subtilis Miyagi-4]|nr:hypothetical protein BSMD_005190 [Bacillus subtilis Miyagi-4]
MFTARLSDFIIITFTVATVNNFFNIFFSKKLFVISDVY